MRLTICIAVVLALALTVSGFEQQRVLRRVIKSTPTANQLTRVRMVSVRSASAEPGAVAQISSKEAASFGQRSTGNETQQNASATPSAAAAIKAKQVPASTTTTTTTSTTRPTPTTTTSTTTTTTAATPTSTQAAAGKLPRASERQQQVAEVELLSSAPSSWQTMTAVEAPAAALIAAGTRPAVVTSDLSTASSEDNSHHSSEILRSSASSTKGSSYTQSNAGETFSRLRQQSKQQSFFYPQQAPQPVRASGKTSQQATKTHWYQPTTTQRPAPIIQEQQYEQQNEQYVEQQQQVEYPSAPLGQAEPFAFDFKTQDNSGNGQYRKEESDKNGVVRGSYGYTDANGIYRHVEYVADQNGFRANIKSNEPGLIGETQPASIKLDGGSAPARISNNNNDNGDWTSNSNNNDGSSSADLAVAPPDFESSHRAERIRSPRHFRN